MNILQELSIVTIILYRRFCLTLLEINTVAHVNSLTNSKTVTPEETEIVNINTHKINKVESDHPSTGVWMWTIIQ